LQFSEAKLLAFPVRSAKGSFAWTTSPLILLRAIRDGVLEHARTTVKEPADNEVVVSSGSVVLLPTNQVVLEEYTFKKADGDAKEIAAALGGLLQGDPVWTNISERLVIVSDGMMSFYTRSACEIAQHVKINDETGTAEGGALFNQENVPSETLFYAVTTAIDSRVKGNEYSGKTATDALDAFAKKLSEVRTFQFGGDASTGLGYCTVELAD
jgi:CRISPR-associated protein Cmr4